jgi:gamma-glutamyltranspeptidase/glutathione hydrolase
VFLPKGRAPLPGEKWSAPDLARTLERIAATEGEDFYRGDLAAQIARAAQAEAGALSAEDLAAHQPEWVQPIGLEYRGLQLNEIPPNGQGLAALMALGILEHFDLSSFAPDSVDSLHLQIEAMKLALADAAAYIADVDFMLRVSWRDLLAPDYLRERARLIDRTRAATHAFGMPVDHGTVYLTAADESGMMVSFIQSNFWGFGSGCVVPGTGISLQNRGQGFCLQCDHPNQVGPRKRPFHTIIPGFVLQQGRPLMSFGVMGGSMQAQGHVQMLTRLADHGQNPQAASDAPRWRVYTDLQVSIEEGTPKETVQALADMGHDIALSSYENFGGAQLIYRMEDGYCAASDSRKDGQAVGR